MVGGNETDFHRALPILNLMGKTITRVGEVGDGQTAKVANQIIVGLTIEAVAEALTFAQQAGADPARVRQAIMGGFASSRVLELHGQRMIDGTFEPGFRIRLHRKDIGLAVEAAKTLGVSLPSCSLAAQLMDDAVSKGLGELDHSAMILAMNFAGGSE